MKQTHRALVLTGDGINCEEETALAFQMAGFETKIRHLNDLISEQMSGDQLIKNFKVLALPGGFSFGDDLGSGKVLALKIQHGLKWDLNEFAERGGLVIGICNGFQALIKMGLFGEQISITHNSTGKFMNSWTRVRPQPSGCVWLKGITTLDLPIRHGEGRIIVTSDNRSAILAEMDRHGKTCLKYEFNPNGSESSLAGLCDDSGRIFGLMPHPEAFVRWTSYPEWTLQPTRAGSSGDGLKIFENAYRSVQGGGR